MEANEAPEKIYLYTEDNILDNDWLYEAPEEFTSFEYTRTDAFIEKACEFLKSYRQDAPDGYGYIAGIVNDKTIDDFKNYMKGE